MDVDKQISIIEDKNNEPEDNIELSSFNNNLILSSDNKNTLISDKKLKMFCFKYDIDNDNK